MYLGVGLRRLNRFLFVGCAAIRIGGRLLWRIRSCRLCVRILVHDSLFNGERSLGEGHENHKNLADRR